MKEKRVLFNVSILALVVLVCGLGLTPYAMAHSIGDVVMVPKAPAGLLDGEPVTVRFSYVTEEERGVRIYATPYTKGKVTPGAQVSQSPLYQVGKGEGSVNFTIYSQDIMVDEVQLMMTTSDQSSVLLDFFIEVEYLFYAHSITNIVLSPPSPATLMPNDYVNMTFDYATTEAGGVKIWARPFSNGSLTPNYFAHGSPNYPSGYGSGTGFFRIPYGNVMVDQIRFQMYNISQTVLLRELFIPVKYRYCDGACVWHVDADAPGANTGTDWFNAFNDLQDAFEAAAPGDKIKVAEGTYKPDQGAGQTPGDRAATFQLISGVAIKGGYGGFGEPDPDARDIEAYETILTGDLQGNDGPDFTNNSDNSYHVLYSNNNDPTTILDGFTVTGGNADGTYPSSFGGGMLIWTGSPTVSNCIFKENKADEGGGLAALQVGSPFLFNCIFIANSAGGTAGGGLNFQNSSPILRSCMILGNSAPSGGGIETRNNRLTTPTYTNCVFSGNTATGNGGAISHGGSAVEHYPTELLNCSFNENSASGDGGGIYNWGGDDLTLNSCILWANTDAGGTDESAQFTASSGSPTIKYSCLQGWTGGWGGTGNIGDDPLFVDADGADDAVGTEDDDVHLLEGSPCIDTGHPAAQYQDIDGSRNDMGAYGGQFGEITEPPVYFGTGFIITNIGELPTTEIGRDANEPNVGLANVEPDIAALFGVPQYKDSPFGGTLRVRGQFGLYDDVDFYQMMLAKWVDGNEPAPEDYEVLDDEKGALQLGKVRWYVDANGWNQEYVRMGPKTIDGRDYLYQLNSPLDGSIWSNPDLRIRWNTKASENGLYTLTYKAYRWADPCQTTLVDVNLPPTDGWDHIILLIDNNPVTATIHNVKYDPCSPNYDDPCDGEIPECAIIGLTDADENLRFTITAKHSNGYLRKWVLDALYGKNRYAGVIASDSYTRVSPPYWDGVLEQEFQSEDSTSLDPWEQCAYQFRLRAWARTTNGTSYVYSAAFSDHYYMDFGVTTCLRADIDGSGMVDLRDAAELFNHYLDTCGP